MRFCFLLLLSSFLIAPIQGNTKEQDILKNVLDHYIVPAYDNFKKNTFQLSQALTNYCDQPNHSPNLEKVNQAYQQAVLSWARIEWLRLGPAIDENRVERILFFPDRKNTGLKQVKATLSQQDDSVLDANRLENKSVAVQGFGALEYLLFDDDIKQLDGAKESFRCQFAQSISENLMRIAQQVSSVWKEDATARKEWLKPEAKNSFFRSDAEAMKVIIRTIIHGIEAIRDTRINPFLRTEAKRDRPRSAAFWRSDLTMLSIAENLAGLESLFTQSRIKSILSEDTLYLDAAIRFDFQQAIETAQALNQPIAYLLSDKQKRDDLEFLKLSINFLLERLNKELGAAIGLTAGFSFGDGD